MYQTKLFKKSAIALSLTLFAGTSMAQDATGFLVTAEAQLANDDNIFRVTDDLAQSDTYINITPELELVGGWGAQRFSVTYKGDYAKYSDVDDANYNDHDIRAKLDLTHSTRLSSSLEAGFRKEHEDAGSNSRIQLSLTEFNQYEQTFLGGDLGYGREDSTGQITIGYRYTDTDYTNNGLDYLDNKKDQLSARFSYRLAPKTRIYIDGLYQTLDYEPAANFELDNTYNSYRIGISWDFANKLSGDINIGYQNRDYDQEGLRDSDGLAYDGTINWAINTYTRLSFTAVKESLDSNIEGAGGFERSSYIIDGRHQLTTRLDLTGSAYYAKDELVFGTDRDDKRYAYELGLAYDLMSFVELTGGYRYEERDSTFEGGNFKANILFIGITADLEM